MRRKGEERRGAEDRGWGEEKEGEEKEVGAQVTLYWNLDSLLRGS